MDRIIEFLSYTLPIVFFTFIFSKVIATIIQQIYEKKINKKKDHKINLDVMIENQKKLMQSQNTNMPEFKNTKQKETKKYMYEIQEIYNSRLKSISPLEDKQEFQDIAEFLKAIDDLAWGGGEFYTAILKQLKNKYFLEVDIPNITSLFRLVITGNDILQLKNLRQLPSTDHFRKLICANCILESFYDSDLSEYFIEQIAKKLSTLPATLKKCIVKFKEKKEKIIIFSFIDKSSLYTPKELFSELEKLCRFEEVLIELPELNNKNDITTAKEIFKIKNDIPDKKELKKIYLKLAKKYHPDSLDINLKNEETSKVSQKNFQKLKDAYEILKSSYQKNS
ncbi:MAG: J domain-containing protein [Halobacteriovoraceae bacterium]|nr:J domain-containing protein [Halobacteriovoraceae bacterium]